MKPIIYKDMKLEALEKCNLCSQDKRWSPKTGKIICSVGVGLNKLISKIASGYQKTDELQLLDLKMS